MPIPLVTRILIADDFPIVRSGLRKVLDAKHDLEVVAEAEDGHEAVEKALAEDVDLVILDVSMPRMTGIQAAAELHKRKPELKVLMLSMHDSEQFLFEALKAGASGYVLKHEADHELVDAVRAVHRGESFLTNAAERSLVREWMSDDSAGPREPLSPREQEVLKLIAEAHTNREIGEILHLAEKTVESHRGNILRKLGMRDRVELVRYAIRRGLVEP
jgi:DNA-binding NarL/FixJ family response regulator